MVPLRRRAPLCSATGTSRAFADLGLAPPLACREPLPVRPSPRSRDGSSRARRRGRSDSKVRKLFASPARP
jgi:hypothetical protein